MSKGKNLLKTKDDYAKYYKRVLDYSLNDGYICRIPELPGCVTHADTAEGAIKNSFEAIVAYLDMLEEDGEQFPTPTTLASEIKNFALRIDVGTFETLKALARGMNLSLNEFIVRRLKEDGSYQTIAQRKISPEINFKVARHLDEESHRKNHSKKLIEPQGGRGRGRKASSKKAISSR